MSASGPHGEGNQAGVETVHDAGFNLAWDQPAPTVPPELTGHSKRLAARIYRAAGCVYCAVGYAVANAIFSVGKDALVVCDTTESLPAAKRVFEDFKRAVPQAAALPLRAVIYTRNHLDHIAGVRMELRYAPSAADDEIVIWLPDLRVLLSAEVPKLTLR